MGDEDVKYTPDWQKPPLRMYKEKRRWDDMDTAFDD